MMDRKQFQQHEERKVQYGNTIKIQLLLIDR